VAGSKLAIGLVTTRDEAEVAVRRIMFCGYRRQDISLLMSESTRKRCCPKAARDTASASAFGAAVATSVVVPGLGVVVAGPIAAALASAVWTGTGGVACVLVSAGIPEKQACFYELCLLDGGILVGLYARTEKDAELVEMILEDFSGIQVRSSSTGRRAFDSYI
jgi:hypothetical protein